MFKTAFQKGLLTIFYGGGPTPLAIWESKTQNGYIKRLTDPDIMSLVMEISSVNVSTTYISCPPHGQTLGIHMPFLIMVVKNMNKLFTFEVTILDQSNFRRRFRVSNFESVTRIQPFCTTMPITLSSGWNKIQFNLAEFTAKAYKTQFVEVQRVRIHANIRLKRIYFAERIYEEDEMPSEYKLYFPVKSATRPRSVSVVKENIGDENKENITSNILSSNVLRDSSAANIEGPKVLGNRNSKSSINVASLSYVALVKASSSMNLKSVKSKSETFINRIKSRQSTSDLKTTAYDKETSYEDLLPELSGLNVLSEINLDSQVVTNIDPVDKNTIEHMQDEAVNEVSVSEKLSQVVLKAMHPSKLSVVFEVNDEDESFLSPKKNHYNQKSTQQSINQFESFSKQTEGNIAKNLSIIGEEMLDSTSKCHFDLKDKEIVLQDPSTQNITSYLSLRKSTENEGLTKIESQLDAIILKTNDEENKDRNISWQNNEEHISQDGNIEIPEGASEQVVARENQIVEVFSLSTNNATLHFSQNYAYESKTLNESVYDNNENFEENPAELTLREPDLATEILAQQQRVHKTMGQVINIVRCPSKLSVVLEEENDVTEIESDEKLDLSANARSEIMQHQMIFHENLEMCFYSDNECENGTAD